MLTTVIILLAVAVMFAGWIASWLVESRLRKTSGLLFSGAIAAVQVVVLLIAAFAIATINK